MRMIAEAILIRALDLLIHLFLRVRLNRLWISKNRHDLLRADLPCIFISNHTSWYDGFVVRQLARELQRPGPIFFPMLEAELKKSPVLRLLGAIPISPTRFRTTFRNLKERRASLQHKFNLAYFPQGQIVSTTSRNLHLKKGVLRLLRELDPIQVVVVGIHIEPFTTIRPHVLCSFELLREKVESLDPIELSMRKTLQHIHEALEAKGEKFISPSNTDWHGVSW